jgi:hypothetical protein
MKKLSWHLTLGSTSGLSAGDIGSTDVEAETFATITLDPAMVNPIEWDLQLERVESLDVFLLTSTLYEEMLEVQGSGEVFKLTGPLLLFGDSIKHFSPSLDKLKLQNKHADKKAELKVLIGRKLAIP